MVTERKSVTIFVFLRISGLEEERDMSKKKKIIVAVVIIAAAAVAVGFFLKSKLGKSSSGGDAAYVESVQSLVNGVNGGGQNRYMGVVESQDTWDVNLSSDQTVKEIFVSVGDEVQEGTPLFEYKTDDLSLQIAQAKLELESIASQINDYNNQIKTLTTEKNAASKEEQFNYTVQIQSLQTSIKQSEYEQQSKKLEIQKMEDTMSQSTVTSKINGVVKSINEKGETDSYGNEQPFMSILTTGDYRVKGTVNETNVYDLTEGQSVILRSRVDETKTWTGTIEKIDTENEEKDNNNGVYYSGSDSENQSTKYPFYVTLDSADGLMLGQHLYVELDEGQTETKDGIWLYSGYIVQDDDAAYVWADNGKGKLEKRTVELGEYDEGMDLYEIKSGLELNDMIAWPVSGFREGLKTTTNVDEGMMEEFPDDDMYSEDMGEGYTEDLSSEGEELDGATDSYSQDEDIDTGMLDEKDLKPVVDGEADTGSADAPTEE